MKKNSVKEKKPKKILKNIEIVNSIVDCLQSFKSTAKKGDRLQIGNIKDSINAIRKEGVNEIHSDTVKGKLTEAYFLEAGIAKSGFKLIYNNKKEAVMAVEYVGEDEEETIKEKLDKILKLLKEK